MAVKATKKQATAHLGLVLSSYAANQNEPLPVVSHYLQIVRNVLEAIMRESLKAKRLTDQPTALAKKHLTSSEFRRFQHRMLTNHPHHSG